MNIKKILSFKGMKSFVVLFVSCIIAIFIFSLKSKPEKKEIKNPVPVVKLICVEPETKIMTVKAFGTVKSGRSLKISAEVSGRVEFINSSFKEGGFVKKDDVLIKIDSRLYKFNKQMREVNIIQAKADISKIRQDIKNLKSNVSLSTINAKLSAKDLERIKSLVTKEFATKAHLDQAEQRDIQAKMQLQDFKNRLAVTNSVMKQKKAQLKMAKINFNKAILDLEKTEIKANFDGYILQKTVETGEFVKIGQILGNMYMKNALEVDVRIPLKKMKWLDPVFKKGIKPKALVKMTGAGQDSIWQAHAIMVKAKIDEKTRTLPITLKIDVLDKKNILNLRPGSFVKCIINGIKYDNIFVIPKYLLKNNNMVFVEEQERLFKKKVEILRNFENQVYITKGLKSGDKIISSPVPQAFEGMKIIAQKNKKQADTL